MSGLFQVFNESIDNHSRDIYVQEFKQSIADNLYTVERGTEATTKGMAQNPCAID